MELPQDIYIYIYIYDYMGYQNHNSMFIHPVTESEIINVVKCCKLKNLMDCNDISMYVVKSG